MKTENYSHLVGRKCFYRLPYQENTTGTIVQIRQVFSISGTGYVAIMDSGDEVDLSLCHFSDPIC